MKKTKFNRSTECAKIIRQRISGGLSRKPQALSQGNSFINELKFDKNGLIPTVIQDYKTRAVLMVAYMNKESLKVTIKEGKTCFWSRSRKKFWIKGETSGCFQFVKGIYYDCDMDCLLIKVRQKGAACHTGEYSCFFRRIK